MIVKIQMIGFVVCYTLHLTVSIINDEIVKRRFCNLVSFFFLPLPFQIT